MHSQTMAVQKEMPTTVRLSEYLREEKMEVEASAEDIAVVGLGVRRRSGSLIL